MRLPTYVVTVASLTVGAQALLQLGRHLGIYEVVYPAGFLFFFCPGFLYVRWHPAWTSREASANRVGLDTAGGVLLGVIITATAAYLPPLAGWFRAPATLRDQIAALSIPVIAPMFAYLMASHGYERRSAAPERTS